MEKVIHTQLVIHINSYAHNLSLEKKYTHKLFNK
jgi:hypothetical protein